MSFKKDAEFVHYLETIVNLDALDRMTRDLDEELKDAQLVMDDIKKKIDSFPVNNDQVVEPGQNILKHEDKLNFFTSGTPQLLMDDMVDDIVELDLDNVIAALKYYTEDIKKNLSQPELPEARVPIKIEKLDMEPYAKSLEQLCKRISNLKLGKDEANRNTELEEKLGLLCDDVNMFTKMVAAKKSLSEANQNWTQSTSKIDWVLEYDNLINKLLSGINEVSYLLLNNK